MSDPITSGDDLALDHVDSQTPARRALPYVLKGARADVLGGGVVAKGKSVKSADPYLIHEDGRVQQAIRLQAVGAAIKDGILPVREIVALWAKSGALDAPDNQGNRDALLVALGYGAENAPAEDDAVPAMDADPAPEPEPDPAPEPDASKQTRSRSRK